jgi:hypothetical protein
MVFVQRDECKQTLGHLDLGLATSRCAMTSIRTPIEVRPDTLDMGKDRYEVAQMDRRDKLHPLDRHCRDRALGAQRRRFRAAMSIWLSTQPPKMWPLALMSVGPGITRRIGTLSRLITDRYPLVAAGPVRRGH